MRKFIIITSLLLCGQVQAKDNWTPNTNLNIQNLQPTIITISINKSSISISLKDGKVTFSDDLNIDNAAKLFWKAVEKNIPACTATIDYK